jgi:predicted RNA-binding Zn ribbon-like protein
VQTLLGLDREPGSALPLDDQLRFDAGGPALNLLATVGRRGSPAPVDRMATPARLREWLAGNGLDDVVPGADEAAGLRDLGELHGLRACGYPVLAALAAGHPAPTADLEALGDYAARPRGGPALQVRPDGGIAWAPRLRTVQDLLVDLARELAATAVLRAGDLHLCDADRCRMVYLDASRGRRRRWCSMERCGNAAKAARLRARRSGRAGA